MKREYLNLTIFTFGLVLIFDRKLIDEVIKCGWETLRFSDSFAIGLSYPRWVYRLFHYDKVVEAKADQLHK